MGGNEKRLFLQSIKNQLKNPLAQYVSISCEQPFGLVISYGHKHLKVGCMVAYL